MRISKQSLDLRIAFVWTRLEFFGPQMALAYQLDAISQAKKLSISRAQPHPTCPRNGYARIKNITHGAAYKS
jgi:hypothetical protein